MAAAGLAAIALVACGGPSGWHEIDVSGASPALSFSMTEAPKGERVSAADFRGKITLLYFGYTYCPDVCPTTLANIAEILGHLGADAQEVQVLFVTIDPNRDTLGVLGEYASNFGPQVVGLRGTADEIASLARRYRIVYSVNPGDKDHPYEVTHSGAVYVFDRSGAARLLISSLGTGKPDVAGVEADLKRLIGERR